MIRGRRFSQLYSFQLDLFAPRNMCPTSFKRAGFRFVAFEAQPDPG